MNFLKPKKRQLTETSILSLPVYNLTQRPEHPRDSLGVLGLTLRCLLSDQIALCLLFVARFAKETLQQGKALIL